jgi:hypothetical protein
MFFLAVLVSLLAFASVTVTLVRMLRLSFRIRKFFLDSLTLSLTLPRAGTVNDFLARRTRARRLTTTLPMLSKAATPVRPGSARKLKLKRPVRLTRIDDLEPAKLALAGGFGGGSGGGSGTTRGALVCDDAPA